MNFIKLAKFKLKFHRENPDYFDPSGLLVFCGVQGSGKTLSAVSYVKKLLKMYPKAKLVTNTDIQGLPDGVDVIEYTGIESLTTVENGIHGVVYFIDEIHLEFNSLESKNIPIEVMVEVSQQRKQRKHIVGTSQVYGRMAKPLREQIKNVVLCNKYLGCIQINKLIDGDTAVEIDGKLKYDVKRTFIWLHSPKLYDAYDTYKKMKRYRQEWKGVSRPTNV